MRKFVATAIVACLAVGVAFAADAIKLDGVEGLQI